MEYIISTQMRVGSNWLNHILRSLLKFKFIPITVREQNPDNIKKLLEEHKRVRCHWVNPKDLCEFAKVISLTRELKDIFVSKIWYIYSVEMERDESFMNRKISEDKQLFDFTVTQWKMYNEFKHPNYLLIHYEDMWNNLNDTIKKVLNFLNVHKTDEEINKVCERFKPMESIGLIPCSRKGIIGDWKNYLNEENIVKINES